MHNSGLQIVRPEPKKAIGKVSYLMWLIQNRVTGAIKDATFFPKGDLSKETRNHIESTKNCLQDTLDSIEAAMTNAPSGQIRKDILYRADKKADQLGKALALAKIERDTLKDDKLCKMTLFSRGV